MRPTHWLVKEGPCARALEVLGQRLAPKQTECELKRDKVKSSWDGWPVRYSGLRVEKVQIPRLAESLSVSGYLVRHHANLIGCYIATGLRHHSVGRFFVLLFFFTTPDQ